MRALDAVLFDLDGTVLELGVTSADVDAARERLRALFLGHGVDVVFRPILGTVKRSLEFLSAKGLETGELRRCCLGVLDEMEVCGAVRAVLRQGMREVLEGLRDRGYRLALVSNNGRLGIHRALEQVGLAATLFSAVVSRDDVEEEKPSPAPVLAALERLSIRQGRVAFVGDHPNDVLSARRAGRAMDGKVEIFAIYLQQGMKPVHVVPTEADVIVTEARQIVTALGAVEQRPFEAG